MTTQDSDRSSFRPAVYVNGEEVVYAASSLGSCTRALAAARQELEPYTGPLPENIAETFQRGHDAEEYGKKWFRDRGWSVTDEQREVVLQLTPRIKVVGHVDFAVSKLDVDMSIVDSKRQNDEEFSKGSIMDSWLWDKYVWQFASYQLAWPGMAFTVQRISDSGDVKLEVLTGVLRTKGQVLSRVLAIEQMATRQLRKEVCDKSDFPCPYWRVLHDREEWEEVEDTELADLALHYRRLMVEIAPLQKRHKEIREALIKKVSGRVREMASGIEVMVTEYATKEKVIPAGKSTRVSVRLPDDSRAEQ